MVSAPVRAPSFGVNASGLLLAKLIMMNSWKSWLRLRHPLAIATRWVQRQP
jgi:hypothetical protein